jgi:hypothetical protein
MYALVSTLGYRYFVAVVLYSEKYIWQVVGAIPLNGGAYNVLLNTSTKRMASLAATLTVYHMATAINLLRKACIISTE